MLQFHDFVCVLRKPCFLWQTHLETQHDTARKHIQKNEARNFSIVVDVRTGYCGISPCAFISNDATDTSVGQQSGLLRCILRIVRNECLLTLSVCTRGVWRKTESGRRTNSSDPIHTRHGSRFAPKFTSKSFGLSIVSALIFTTMGSFFTGCLVRGAPRPA